MLTTASGINVLTGIQAQPSVYKNTSENSNEVEQTSSQQERTGDSVTISRKAQKLQQTYQDKKYRLDQDYEQEKAQIEREYLREKKQLDQEFNRRIKSLNVSVYA